MKTPFPDWLVLTTILLTLLVVFALDFTEVTGLSVVLEGTFPRSVPSS